MSEYRCQACDRDVSVTDYEGSRLCRPCAFVALRNREPVSEAIERAWVRAAATANLWSMMTGDERDAARDMP